MSRPAEQPDSDDLALMRRIAGRDAEAMRLLYARHSGLVYAICLRVLHDRGEAEQALIDVFAELWERCDRYGEDRGSVGGYLALVARSRAIDRSRSRAAQSRNAKAMDAELRHLAADVADPTDPMAADERAAAVNAALATLSVEQRVAVELAFYEGLSHSEIAARLARPLGTVKTQIRQGLIHLRTALRTYWQGDRTRP